MEQLFKLYLIEIQLLDIFKYLDIFNFIKTAEKGS